MNREEPGHRAVRRSRVCLISGTFVYLGLALMWGRWFPDNPVIAAILIAYAAHTAAYLARDLTETDAEDRGSGQQ